MHDNYSLINLLAPAERNEISKEFSNIVFLRALKRACDELKSEAAVRFNNLFNALEDSPYSDDDRFNFFYENMPNFPKYLVEEAVNLRKELNNRSIH